SRKVGEWSFLCRGPLKSRRQWPITSRMSVRRAFWLTLSLGFFVPALAILGAWNAPESEVTGLIVAGLVEPVFGLGRDGSICCFRVEFSQPLLSESSLALFRQTAASSWCPSKQTGHLLALRIE